jgi:hypothetical protein
LKGSEDDEDDEKQVSGTSSNIVKAGIGGFLYLKY